MTAFSIIPSPTVFILTLSNILVANTILLTAPATEALNNLWALKLRILQLKCSLLFLAATCKNLNLYTVHYQWEPKELGLLQLSAQRDAQLFSLFTTPFWRGLQETKLTQKQKKTISQLGKTAETSLNQRFFSLWQMWICFGNFLRHKWYTG